MKRLRFAALAFAGALALVVTGGHGALATTDGSAQASASACSTWQYRITDRKTIYEYPGGPSTGVRAYRSDIFNANITGDSWYRGNFYTADRKWYAYGWVTDDDLNYVTCW